MRAVDKEEYILPKIEPSLEYFREYASVYASLIDKELLKVEFIVAFLERAMLAGSGHTYYDPYIMVQLVSGAQGYCFMDPIDFNQSQLEGIAGRLALDLLKNVPIYIEIAIVDAIFFHLNIVEKITPTRTFKFQGLASSKSQTRANKLIELAGVKIGQRVLLIGAIVDIIDAILKTGATLDVADFALAGMRISNIIVQYDATPLIEKADIIIMTGNTLKTNTLAGLLSKCNNLNKQILVYAMSGANIAPHYRDFGVSVVTVEPFPYYWYAQTPSRMLVYFR